MEKSSIEQKQIPTQIQTHNLLTRDERRQPQQQKITIPLRPPQNPKQSKITSSPLTSKIAPPAGKKRDTPNQTHQQLKSNKLDKDRKITNKTQTYP